MVNISYYTVRRAKFLRGTGVFNSTIELSYSAYPTGKRTKSVAVIVSPINGPSDSWRHNISPILDLVNRDYKKEISELGALRAASSDAQPPGPAGVHFEAHLPKGCEPPM